MAMVSGPTLLRGAWYSFEQCGFLLRDAVTLYNSGSHSTALGLAMLAREELGKGRILLDFWRDMVERARQVSPDQVRSRLEDHEVKQQKAQLSQTWRAEGDTREAQLLRAAAGGADVATRAAAAGELDALSKNRKKRTPADRHRARMRAMYVDLNEAGDGWLRPSEAAADALGQLTDARNDYAGQWHRLMNGLAVFEADQPELVAAIREWEERPPLPEPAIPKFP